MLDAIPDPHTLSLSQYEKFQAASIIVMCIGLFLAAFRRATRGESMPKDMRVSRCEREEPRKVRFRSKAAEIRYDCRGKVRFSVLGLCDRVLLMVRFFCVHSGITR
ncbi:hypothetical protein AAMO2058_000057000 [Amorphochlora amoebiformis]